MRHSVHHVTLRCDGCATPLVLDLEAGAIRAQDRPSKGLTYLDAALAVWDCPVCEQTDAADLSG